MEDSVMGERNLAYELFLDTDAGIGQRIVDGLGSKDIHVFYVPAAAGYCGSFQFVLTRYLHDKEKGNSNPRHKVDIGRIEIQRDNVVGLTEKMVTDRDCFVLYSQLMDKDAAVVEARFSELAKKGVEYGKVMQIGVEDKRCKEYNTPTEAELFDDSIHIADRQMDANVRR